MLARRLQPELMDDPALSQGEHRRALRGLERINRVSGAGARVWAGVKGVLGRNAALDRDIRLLDVACGSGDVLLDVSSRAAAAHVRIVPTACDFSNEALSAVRERFAAADISIQTLRRDVINDGLGVEDQAFEIVTCSLFLHHLEDDATVSVLREMARVARLGVVVSDLRRCRRGIFAAALAGRVLTRSRVVRVDAVRSAYNAYSLNELRALAERAGLRGAVVTLAFPLRMILTWERT